jgi:DNA-binding response OmpR family regulator
MNRKVLIIDDNEQDRKIAERFLRKSGYTDVVTAETGEEGLLKTESEKPDIVIIDTMLPGINGFETCQKIRQKQGPQIPKIIVVTGSVDAIDAVKARKCGADDYCVKTSDSAPLLQAINNLLIP